MSDKPVMHGWDHRPGGYDPIPGLATGLKWAYQATPSHVTVGTNTNVKIAPTTAVGFFTNDAASFSQGVVSGKYGIQIDAAAGLYLTIATLSPFGAITAGVDYGINSSNGNEPDAADLFLFPIRRLAVSGESVDGQTLSYTSLGTQDAGPPGGPMIFQGENHNSVASFQAFLQVLCIQLDPNQSTYVG